MWGRERFWLHSTQRIKWLLEKLNLSSWKEQCDSGVVYHGIRMTSWLSKWWIFSSFCILKNAFIWSALLLLQFSHSWISVVLLHLNSFKRQALWLLIRVQKMKLIWVGSTWWQLLPVIMELLAWAMDLLSWKERGAKGGSMNLGSWFGRGDVKCRRELTGWVL